MAGTGDIEPPAEARLIRRNRQARGLSVPAAAAATGGMVSAPRWTQIEQGFMIRRGVRVPTRAGDGVLAHMADAVGVTPEQLQELGRGEAAEILRAIQRPRPPRGPQPPDLAAIASYFTDERIPAKQRQRVAARFLALMPYIARGEQPPPELLELGGDPDKGLRTA